MSFYEWLITQRDRKDAVGDFARYAAKGLFPTESSALHLVLRVCRKKQREAAKQAHREFRKFRDSKKEEAVA